MTSSTASYPSWCAADCFAPNTKAPPCARTSDCRAPPAAGVLRRTTPTRSAYNLIRMSAYQEAPREMHRLTAPARWLQSRSVSLLMLPSLLLVLLFLGVPLVAVLLESLRANV